METINKVRTRYFVHSQRISQIARELNLSRNTVRKYLKDDYPLKYQREKQQQPQLGDFYPQLLEMLKHDAQLPVHHRLTAKRMFGILQEKGYQGAYDSVQRAVKAFKNDEKSSTKAFVPLSFAIGEVCQFDWSHETVKIAGVELRVKVAHFRLAYSRQYFVVAYPNERLEMLLDAHNRAFGFFGGVPQKMVYDNLKTVVDAVLRGKSREFNQRFMAMANHYVFEPIACTPASGWEKGQVESQVKFLRNNLFLPMLSFDSFDQLNDWLRLRCTQVADQHQHPEMNGVTVSQAFEQEKANLRAISMPFDGYTQEMKRVNSTSCVHMDRNRYSVPVKYVNKVLSVHLSAEYVSIYDKKEGLVARHQRCFDRNQFIYDAWHYVPILEEKPGAIRDGLPFRNMKLPEPILRVQTILMKQSGGDKAFVDLLLQIPEQGLEAIEVVCELVLEYDAVTGAIVHNELQRMLDKKQPDDLVVSEHFVLNCDPIADLSRYDSLYQQGCVA
jgi:transposase